jgi:hypothetical protein
VQILKLSNFLGQVFELVEIERELGQICQPRNTIRDMLQLVAGDLQVFKAREEPDFWTQIFQQIVRKVEFCKRASERQRMQAYGESGRC